ncbi:MAG: hypothetical protein HY293_18835, partial [Planctomycetes bacterium]|nr:hypothetical protein [Planctomycetota bacterium]
MSEGPVNFGKPLFFLVVIACGGGGYYAYSHWPVHYEGNGWEVDFPHGWTPQPFNDPNSPGKIVAQGPLMDETQGQGAAWATINFHGTIAWPEGVAKFVPGTIEKQDDTEIAHKKALIFEYEDAPNNIRYLCSAVERIDALVVTAIGCNKTYFEQNRVMFE